MKRPNARIAAWLAACGGASWTTVAYPVLGLSLATALCVVAVLRFIATHN